MNSKTQGRVTILTAITVLVMAIFQLIPVSHSADSTSVRPPASGSLTRRSALRIQKTNCAWVQPWRYLTIRRGYPNVTLDLELACPGDKVATGAFFRFRNGKLARTATGRAMFDSITLGPNIACCDLAIVPV